MINTDIPGPRQTMCPNMLDLKNTSHLSHDKS
jgi:hypothetical protein